MDHLIQIPQVDRAWEPIPEPWVTSRLPGRTGHRAPPRHAGLAGDLPRARASSPRRSATLDALSGGRAFCGLGAGWWLREHEAYGLDFPAPRERLDQLQRCIEILRALWAPGTKAFTGRT